MTRLLRFDLDELDAYVTRIAAATGIPAAHIEKDYWVTEVLRGISAASRETSCSIVFKGGSSLSKAHHLIQRFSEDVDLIAVLPAGRRFALGSGLLGPPTSSRSSIARSEHDLPNCANHPVQAMLFAVDWAHGSGCGEERLEA